MSSLTLDFTDKKTPSSHEKGGVKVFPGSSQKPDYERHISPGVAHELNNVLAIVQGYAERLLFKHGEDAALQPHLKMIFDAARRASAIVHDARTTQANSPQVDCSAR